MVLPLISPTSPGQPISPCTPLPSSRYMIKDYDEKTSSIAFEDSCVMVDSNNGTEEEMIEESLNGHEKRGNDMIFTARSESGTTSVDPKNSGTNTKKERPGLNRRLSLSGLINLPLPSPPIKLRALARRLSNSSPPSQIVTSRKSTPASPIITSTSPPIAKRTSATMPIVPPIVPPSPSCADCNPHIKYFWTGESDEQDGVHQAHEKEISNSSKIALSSSYSSSTLTALDEDTVYNSSIPTSSTLQNQPANTRRTPLMSRNSSFADDLTALSEVDESQHHDLSFITPTCEPITPTSPNSRSCSGIWLCSPPTVPFIENTCPTTPRLTSRPMTKTKTRPLVVRSMSTGRLASEFDGDGRVICLSGHSERVLRPSVSPPPSFRSIQPTITTYQSTPNTIPGLSRSKSYQASRTSLKSKSNPSSPIDRPSSTAIPPLPIRSLSEFGKQSSTDRLVSFPPVETPSLTRTGSMGSWRKKNWQVGRSVRV
ncbi:hypothetical protein L486_02226 [Kwoniella mangroviensis CBS 10435]|uniref:Uncharacterized protein n=1 Tax=Kwoniella mangroviensis CBS 10435 TaxID=1331196 RepID=A0A1B9IVJ4_9TREE|nr:hypothetical protein L486_02226 [Kwoniella mangroviensis CBS 10435]